MLLKVDQDLAVALTKATAAFKCNFGVYGPILFKLYMQVAYRPLLMICYMAFTIKCQTKAAMAFKGNWCLLTDFVQTLHAGSLLATVGDLLHDLYNQRPNKGHSSL